MVWTGVTNIVAGLRGMFSLGSGGLANQLLRVGGGLALETMFSVSARGGAFNFRQKVATPRLELPGRGVDR